jgi:hypothetical protein
MSLKTASLILFTVMLLGACGDSSSEGETSPPLQTSDATDTPGADVAVEADSEPVADGEPNDAPNEVVSEDTTMESDSEDAALDPDTEDTASASDTVSDVDDAWVFPDIWSEDSGNNGGNDGGQSGDGAATGDSEDGPCQSNEDCPYLMVCGALGCTCPDGYECDGVCLDVQTSLEHCGECDNACGTGSFCDMGMCACAASQMNCDGDCADPKSDPNHCGWCNNACAEGSICQDSACSPLPPKLIWPPAGATVGTVMPIFEVALEGGGYAANVKVCANPECTSLVTQFVTDGATGGPTNMLNPGVYYWTATTITTQSVGQLQSPVWSFTLQDAGGETQLAWGASIDFNHDNRGDVLTGGCGAGACTKKAYLYYSEPPGIDTDLDLTLEPPPDLGDQLAYGWAVESAGDVNGDGHIDIIIGGGLSGGVYVHLNSADGVDPAPANIWADGNSFFGFSVAAAGDVNRDGYGDIVVGSLLDLETLQPVPLHVHHGGPNGLSDAPDSKSMSTSLALGTSVAGACDVNGDGYADVIAGANTDEVFVFHGGPEGLSETQNSHLLGTGTFGIDVACAGDVNGDGYADALVGAAAVGMAHLFLGSEDGLSNSPQATLTGPGDYGLAVSSAGDVNGDGYSDIAIGGNGTVEIFFGSPTGVAGAPNAVLVGQSPYFGQGISASDTNGDKLSDILVTQVGVKNGAENVWTGTIYVFLGSAFGVSSEPAVTLQSPEGDEGFGFSIANAPRTLVPGRTP